MPQKNKPKVTLTIELKVDLGDMVFRGTGESLSSDLDNIRGYGSAKVLKAVIEGGDLDPSEFLMY